MKTKTIFLGHIIIVLALSFQFAHGQNGMDYDQTFGATFNFSKLRRTPNPNQAFQNNFNEKAIAVYTQLGILPTAALEVNTDFTHMPAFLSTWYNRGNVFSTNCPVAQNSIWSMSRGGALRGRIFNPTGGNLFTVESSLGSLTFNTSGANERMRIDNFGRVMINSLVPLATSNSATTMFSVTAAQFEQNIAMFSGSEQFNRIWLQNASPLANSCVDIGNITNSSPNPNISTGVFRWYNINNAIGTADLGYVTRGVGNVFRQSLTLLSNGTAGINQVNPTDNLEIQSFNAGQSGLKFTNLAFANIQNNPGPGVLALNANNQVIYVNASTNSIGTCTTPTQLSANSGIQLNNFNMSFIGNGAGSGTQNNVGIGLPCGTANAKLDVLQSSTATQTIGFNVENTDVSGGGFATPSIGLQCRVTNAADRFKIAAFIEAVGPAPAQARAIIVPALGGFTGLWTTLPTTQLQIGVQSDGTFALANAWNTFSDSTLKTNVKTIPNGLALVKKLRGITFNWNSNNNPGIGLIAQEVERVLPLTVKTDSVLGYKSVDYSKIVPVLIEGIKQLDSISVSKDSIINQLLTRMSSLESTVDACCNNNNLKLGKNNSNNTGHRGENGIINVDLNNIEVPILYQNEPNPFGEQTTIRYFIPENSGKAQIMFYDEFGRTIKAVDITEKGSGKLEISTLSLSNGIYSYSMQVNGKTADTKRMIRNK